MMTWARYYTNHDYGLLFNRLKDPNETVNLWKNMEYSDIKQELLGQLMEEIMCSFDQINERIQKPVPKRRKWVAKNNLEFLK